MQTEGSDIPGEEDLRNGREWGGWWGLLFEGMLSCLLTTR